MPRTRILGLVFFGIAFFALAEVQGGGDSESKVKAKATAAKIDDKGNQMVSLTLAIDKGWHLYANPVNHNQDSYNQNKTLVTFAVNGKAVRGLVSYPAGKTKIDKDHKYDIYVGTVKINALVQRLGDTNPLEITISLNACDDDNCLNRGKIKLTVP